jgi:hypothetical protein
MKLRRFLVPLLFCLSHAAQTHAEEQAPPKLVVAIIVDQLRYDYLERFEPQFSERGFRLLLQQGAFLTYAHYDYAPTVTGPGHASYLSGTTPSAHGIISNDWFDKRTLKSLNCVADADAETVGAPGNAGKRSPRNFIGSTFADELRLRYQSKVVGISLKDRGAILPAGHKPLGAYWFDSASGNFITSTYYRKELPEWVRNFNAQNRPASMIGQPWKRLLEPAAYQWPDDAAGEGRLAGENRPTFDHTVYPSKTEGFETLAPTPFGNQLVADFALAALEGEHLGEGVNPDLLCISFSSTDIAGHIFGPYSQEMQDIVLRLDRQLEVLFKQLDQKIGLANVTILLTADHGVAPTPEFAVEQGLDGKRVDSLQLMQDLLAQLETRFGPGKYLLSPRLVDGNLYFNQDTLREKQIAAEDMAGFIRNWALNSGEFQAAYTRSQLLDGRAPGALGQRVLNGFNAERSGDIVLVPKPFHLAGGASGTTHGTPYAYDTHVPVLLFGKAFKPGRYAEAFSMIDLAPTLSATLGMTEPSGCIGKPFTPILQRK